MLNHIANASKIEPDAICGTEVWHSEEDPTGSLNLGGGRAHIGRGKPSISAHPWSPSAAKSNCPDRRSGPSRALKHGWAYTRFDGRR